MDMWSGVSGVVWSGVRSASGVLLSRLPLPNNTKNNDVYLPGK